MRKLPKFRLGHLYVVDYDDHWSSEKAWRANELGKPMVLRQRGLCTCITTRTVVIEHNTHLSDGPGDARSDRHGILKLAIRHVQHLGKER